MASNAAQNVDHSMHGSNAIVVVTVELAGRASFVYSCMQKKLMSQYTGK